MTTAAILTRRTALLGAAAALSGCSALSALNSAAQPLDTYDLTPASGSRQGRQTGRTLLVARPEAPATIASDRIMIKPNAVAVTYLPEARWSDALPLVIQSVLIRSISGTGRVGYVGQSDGGPVPDTALLVRLDAFQVTVLADGRFQATVDIALTALDDRNQQVTGSRSFAQTAVAADTTPAAVIAAFQTVLNTLLPTMADWAVDRA